MDTVVHQLRIIAGGLLCGGAFMVVILAVAGAL